ncbi:MAG: hypothetical protein ABL994_22735 [Verrucomicrobiales bacterium]
MNTSDITQIEKQIAQLERQLKTALEQQVREAQSRLQALSGGGRRSSVAEAPSTRAIAVEGKAPKVATRALRGRPPGSTVKKKRTRMASDLVNEKIISTVKGGPSEGLSQKDISVRSGVNYQTTAKKLRELSGIVKKGSGKESRYFFKG